jgi:hypothetical protein
MGPVAFAAALVLAAAAPLQAQDLPVPPAEPDQQAQCMATVTPAEVPAGQTAQRIEVSLSEPIGNVDAFEASGLTLAAPEDLPRVPLAAGGDEPPTPIQMANEGTGATIWLNTSGAEPGDYEFALVGAEGQCQGSVTIAG